MKRLYAPWRSKYLTNKNNSECPFCKAYKTTDDSCHFVLKRLEHSLIMLNRYPYNPGHILIIPNEHVASLEECDTITRAEIMEAITVSIKILKLVLKAPGINIGVNLGGKVAGGSIEEHLHIHVLPRFAGDTNFLPLLCNTKQISFDLNQIYTQLKEPFQANYDKKS